MNKNILIVIVFLSFSFFSTAQSDSDTRFAQANQSYQNKKFTEAITMYETLLRDGELSKELYYNLGNSYYETGAIGKAILNYERALQLGNDVDVAFNLEIAQNEQADQLTSVGATPQQWWENLVSILSVNSWTILLLLLFWIAIAGFTVWLLHQQRSMRKRGFLAGVTGIVVAGLLSNLVYGAYQLEQNPNRAILIKKEIALRAAPDPQSKTINTVHEGLELILLEELNDWYQVRLINGDKGWLPEESFERI